MGHCPICNSLSKEGITNCECGYDFEKCEVVDPIKLQAFMGKFSKKDQWQDEVRTKKKIHEIQ
jgi:hypothetical protein